MIEYNLRHPGMSALILERMGEGKNWKGRQRMNYEK